MAANFRTALAETIRVESFEPQPIRIAIDDLPRPFHSESANQHPTVVPPPEEVVLQAPQGVRVNVFAELASARWLALTPAGDVLCAASRDNTIHLLQDEDGDGVADRRSTFVDESRGANLPFGMAFAEGAFFLANTSCGCY
jgi:glucose/arabinose dehydrogenase